MRPPLPDAVFFMLLCAFLSSPECAHASSVFSDSIHFCTFEAHEHSRHDHPRSAAKRPADLLKGYASEHQDSLPYDVLSHNALSDRSRNSVFTTP